LGATPQARKVAIQLAGLDADVLSRIRDSDPTGSATVEPQPVVLNVPPQARTARLKTQSQRWQIRYQWLVGDTEGHVEIRNIDPDMLRADQGDPNDTAAVVAHIEHRLEAEGYVYDDRPIEEEFCVASWAIGRQAFLHSDHPR